MKRILLIISLFLVISAVAVYAVTDNSSTVVNIGIVSGKLSLIKKPKMKKPVVFKDSKDIPDEVTFSMDGPLVIEDFRGIAEGWKLSVQATPFEESEPSGGFVKGSKPVVLPEGSLVLSFPEKFANVKNENPLPLVKSRQRWIIDEGLPVTIVKADEKSSSGSYRVVFPKDTFQFTIQPNLVKEDKRNFPNNITVYRSYVTWSITAGP